MNSKKLLIGSASAVLILVVCACVYLGLRRDRSKNAEDSRYNLPSAQSTLQPSNDEEIRKLGNSLKHLQSNIDDLQQQLDSDKQAEVNNASNSQPDTEKQAEQDDASPEQKGIFSYVYHLDTIIQNEPRDVVIEDEYNQTMYSKLQEKGAGDVNIINTHCAESLCRTQFDISTSALKDKVGASIPEFIPINTPGIVHPDPTNEDVLNIYFATEGNEMPLRPEQ